MGPRLTDAPLTKELCQRHGISEQSLYRWKAKFGGMDLSDAKKLGALGGSGERGWRRHDLPGCRRVPYETR